MDTSKQKISKNAILLYFRTLISMVIALYTSRVVLQALGVHDFGIYSLVGGFVALFAMLNNSMSGATSRFLTYEIGAGNFEKLKKTFSSSLIIHFIIAGVVLLLAETVGLWYVNNKLVIAPERLSAANWVYQFSILASLLSITQIPYNACLIANERFKFYAYVYLLQSFLKLGIALLLLYCKMADNLIIYALLTFLATGSILMIIRIYCVHNLKECRFHWQYDNDIAIPMIKFSLLDMYGNLCFTTRIQGTNLILNRFGGTAINAAAGLAVTVSTALSSFAYTVVNAFSPQIIKQYAAKQIDRMMDLMITAAKFSVITFGIFAVPLFLDMNYVLGLWLTEVPDQTVIFCRIILISAGTEQINQVICFGIHATGNIKRVSFITGSLYLLELIPIYILIYFTHYYAYAYIVHAVFMIFIILTNSTIAYIQIGKGFKLLKFLFIGVMTPYLILIVDGICTNMMVSGIDIKPFLKLILYGIISLVLLLILTYLSSTKDQRRLINDKIPFLKTR